MPSSAFLSELLLPAVQKARIAAAKDSAQDCLQKIDNAAKSFHDRNRTFPENLTSFSEFCAANPALCGDLVISQNGEKNGYSIKVVKSAANSWTIEAEPTCPGITGSETLVLEQSFSSHDGFTSRINDVPTPGAEEAQQKAFENISAEGGRTIAELLSLNPSAVSEVRQFTESPATVGQVFTIFDRNGDQKISIDEVQNLETRNIDPQLASPLNNFLGFVSRELKFDILSDELKTGASVELSDLQNKSPDVFTFDAVCYLSEQYAVEKNIANRLCAMLKAAEAADNRGDLQLKARFLNRYTELVEEQTNINLTRRNAITLILIVKTL